jgi:hypothetical protein
MSQDPRSGPGNEWQYAEREVSIKQDCTRSQNAYQMAKSPIVMPPSVIWPPLPRVTNLSTWDLRSRTKSSASEFIAVLPFRTQSHLGCELVYSHVELWSVCFSASGARCACSASFLAQVFLTIAAHRASCLRWLQVYKQQPARKEGSGARGHVELFASHVESC